MENPRYVTVRPTTILATPAKTPIPTIDLLGAALFAIAILKIIPGVPWRILNMLLFPVSVHLIPPQLERRRIFLHYSQEDSIPGIDYLFECNSINSLKNGKGAGCDYCCQ
jgi:hypothetical protein